MTVIYALELFDIWWLLLCWDLRGVDVQKRADVQGFTRSWEKPPKGVVWRLEGMIAHWIQKWLYDANLSSSDPLMSYSSSAVSGSSSSGSGGSQSIGFGVIPYMVNLVTQTGWDFVTIQRRGESDTWWFFWSWAGSPLFMFVFGAKGGKSHDMDSVA